MTKDLVHTRTYLSEFIEGGRFPKMQYAGTDTDNTAITIHSFINDFFRSFVSLDHFKALEQLWVDKCEGECPSCNAQLLTVFEKVFTDAALQCSQQIMAHDFMQTSKGLHGLNANKQRQQTPYRPYCKHLKKAVTPAVSQNSQKSFSFSCNPRTSSPGAYENERNISTDNWTDSPIVKSATGCWNKGDMTDCCGMSLDGDKISTSSQHIYNSVSVSSLSIPPEPARQLSKPAQDSASNDTAAICCAAPSVITQGSALGRKENGCGGNGDKGRHKADVSDIVIDMTSPNGIDYVLDAFKYSSSEKENSSPSKHKVEATKSNSDGSAKNPSSSETPLRRGREEGSVTSKTWDYSCRFSGSQSFDGLSPSRMPGMESVGSATFPQESIDTELTFTPHDPVNSSAVFYPEHTTTNFSWRHSIDDIFASELNSSTGSIPGGGYSELHSSTMNRPLFETKTPPSLMTGTYVPNQNSKLHPVYSATFQDDVRNYALAPSLGSSFGMLHHHGAGCGSYHRSPQGEHYPQAPSYNSYVRNQQDNQIRDLLSGPIIDANNHLTHTFLPSFNSGSARYSKATCSLDYAMEHRSYPKHVHAPSSSNPTIDAHHGFFKHSNRLLGGRLKVKHSSRSRSCNDTRLKNESVHESSDSQSVGNLPSIETIEELKTLLMKVKNGVIGKLEAKKSFHKFSTCKPCAFFHHPRKLCNNIRDCYFCHDNDHKNLFLLVRGWKRQRQAIVQLLSKTLSNILTEINNDKGLIVLEDEEFYREAEFTMALRSLKLYMEDLIPPSVGAMHDDYLQASVIEKVLRGEMQLDEITKNDMLPRITDKK